MPSRILTGEMFLKQTGGNEIIYFENFEKVRDYMVENMNFQPKDLNFLKEHILFNEHPTLFIDKTAKKYARRSARGFYRTLMSKDKGKGGECLVYTVGRLMPPSWR